MGEGRRFIQRVLCSKSCGLDAVFIFLEEVMPFTPRVNSIVPEGFSWEIQPKVGMGDLKLGMPWQDAFRLFGRDPEQDAAARGRAIFTFADFSIPVKFNKNGELDSFSVSSPCPATFNGQLVCELAQSRLLGILTRKFTTLEFMTDEVIVFPEAGLRVCLNDQLSDQNYSSTFELLAEPASAAAPVLQVFIER
jgi:hypothetical protein